MKTLTPILLILISLLTFFWYIKPQYQKIVELRQTGVLYNEARAEVALVAEQRDRITAEFSSMSQADIKRLEILLPNKVDSLQMVIDINALARKYGTSVKGVKLGDSGVQQAVASDQSGSSLYGTTNISFSVTMAYENFLRFLADLEQSLKLVDVANVTFKPEAPQEGGGSGYTYTVSLNAYYLK